MTLLHALRDGIHPGQPLTELQWADLVEILDTVIEGYDIRERYGIKPKPGAPPTNRHLQKWLALYVLRLCIDDPEKLEKEHVGTVAKVSGLSDKRVADIVREYRQRLQPVAATLPLVNIVACVRALTQDTANPR